jgi:hypothetical protein
LAEGISGNSLFFVSAWLFDFEWTWKKSSALKLRKCLGREGKVKERPGVIDSDDIGTALISDL